jgi:hypothetical protein
MSDAPTPEATDLLDRAEQLLQTGHFAAARKLLAEPPTAGDGPRRAQLLARLAPDPLVAVLIAACLLLFFALIKGYAG